MSEAKKGLGFKEEYNSISREIKKLERKKAEIKVQCSHQDKKGNVKVQPIGNGLYKCDRCGETFKFDPPTQKEQQAAYVIVSNMINQLKILSDPELDAVLIKTLGETLFNLKESMDVFATATQASSKKKKKNKSKNKDNSNGSYGSGNIW